jgi:hypothetical protein
MPTSPSIPPSTGRRQHQLRNIYQDFEWFVQLVDMYAKHMSEHYYRRAGHMPLAENKIRSLIR